MQGIQKIGFVLFLLLMSSSLWAQEGGEEFTLQEAMQYALKNNKNAQINKLDVDAAKGQVKEIQAIGLPQVNIGVNAIRNLKLPVSLVPGEVFGQPEVEFVELPFGTKNNINASLEATQLLFDGSYLLGLKAARLFVERAKMQTYSSDLEIKNNIFESYVGALLAQENLKVLDKNIKVIEQTYFETSQLYENGFIEKLDVDRLQLSLANLKSQRDNASRMYDLAMNALKFQMGLPLQKEIVLTESLQELAEKTELSVVEDTESLQARALSNRMEMKLLDLQNTFRVLDIKQIKAQYLPRVALFYQGQTSFQSNDWKLFQRDWIFSSAIGLNINIPVFDGLQKRGQVQQRLVQQQQAFRQEKLAEESIRLEIMQSQTGYFQALEQVEYQSSNLELAELIYKTTLTKYKEGLGSSLEVTSAESQLYQTQGQYLNALYQLALANNTLNRVLGEAEYQQMND